ncbi:MAG: hypothetical protein KIH69_015710 [Anaerolineae bacterium]|nr:hypothetical protein [Anaerolineae bacterium]
MILQRFYTFIRPKQRRNVTWLLSWVLVLAQVMSGFSALGLAFFAPTPPNLANSSGPGAILLVSFVATPLNSGKGVRVKWTTASEVAAHSFALYRAAGLRNDLALPADAQKVMSSEIVLEDANDTGRGGTYEVIDLNVAAGEIYSYWLIEIEHSGYFQVYGPSAWAGPVPDGLLGKIKVIAPILIR